MTTGPDDVPEGLAEQAMAMGIAFFAGPADLGLQELGREGLLALLRPLPPDETVVLLSCLSNMLHGFGETGISVQLEGVKAWLRGDARAPCVFG